jgi:cytochrome c553
MTAWRRAGPPVAAGLAAAACTFAIVGVVTSGGERLPAPRARPPAAAAPAPAAHAGRAVFDRMGCGSCHRLAAAGATGRIGPSLDGVPDAHTRGSLVAKITAPGANSMMPGDFARRMTGRELDALVGFLLATRGGSPAR